MSALAAVSIVFGVAMFLFASLLIRHLWRHRNRMPMDSRNQTIGLVYAVLTVYCVLTLFGLGVVAIVDAIS